MTPIFTHSFGPELLDAKQSGRPARFTWWTLVAERSLPFLTGLTLITAVLLYWTWLYWRDAARFRDQGLDVVAEFADRYQGKLRTGRPSYFHVYRYDVAGNSYAYYQSVADSVFDQPPAERVLRLRYLPTDPAAARLAPITEASLPLLLILPTLPATVLAIWLWRQQRRWNRWRRLMNEGRLLSAVVVRVERSASSRGRWDHTRSLLRLEYHCTDPEGPSWRGTADYWVDVDTYLNHPPPIGTPLYLLFRHEKDFEVL